MIKFYMVLPSESSTYLAVFGGKIFDPQNLHLTPKQFFSSPSTKSSAFIKGHTSTLISLLIWKLWINWIILFDRHSIYVNNKNNFIFPSEWIQFHWLYITGLKLIWEHLQSWILVSYLNSCPVVGTPSSTPTCSVGFETPPLALGSSCSCCGGHKAVTSRGCTCCLPRLSNAV